MPSKAVCLIGLFVWSIFFCVGGLLLGGCGGAGSRQASFYERLTETTWTVERLESPGFDYTNQLNERYPQGVEVTFRDGDTRRIYEIVSPLSEDSTAVLAEGFVVLNDDVLQMASGFGQFGPVTWTYGFEASRAIFALQSGSRAFMQALFSEGGANEDLEMTLAPDD